MATGQCFCGRVRFRIRGEPKWVAHCHCTMCRRAHAAGYVTWTGFPMTAMTVTAGVDDISTFKSSPAAERRFCRICGSQLFFLSEKYADEVHIPLALVDDTAGLVPTVHVHFANRVDWVPVHDDLPKVDGVGG